MRKWAAGFLVLAAAVLFYVACGDSPTSPGSTGITKTSGPFGPSSGPFGPSSGPFGPSSGPFGPSGGGGPTPPNGTPTPPNGTPTPPSGTPGATPTPTGACPANMQFQQLTPFVTNGGGNGPTISIPSGTFASDCVVDDLRLSMWVETATDLSIHADPAIVLFLSGSSSTQVLEPVAQGFALSGPSLGTGCFDLSFVSNGTPFSIAAPPYQGNFAPYGDPITSVFNTFERFDGFRVDNTSWDLAFYRLDEPMTVQCWRLEFTLRRAP